MATATKPTARKSKKTPSSVTPSNILDGMEAQPVENTADLTTTVSTINDFDETVIPNKSATVEQCKEALQQVGAQFSILDRKQGWMAWLKGKILICARDHACAGRGTREWKKFCEDVGIPKSSRCLFISIAEKYKKSQVTGKTLTELRNAINNGNGKTGNNSTNSNVKSVRVDRQTLSTLPRTLDTTLQVLDCAIKTELGNAQHEDDDPATVYGNCISTLQQIEQRARDCIAEFQTRIDNLKTVEGLADGKGLSLDSREDASALTPAA